jgi:hypothetical protein
MQGRADADHAGAQDNDVGLNFRHPALQCKVRRAVLAAALN